MEVIFLNDWTFHSLLLRRRQLSKIFAMAIPDVDIHPAATGKAADVVAQHQKDELITLYSGWFCPFVQRSWITLEEKKIPYKYVEINPYKKEERYDGLTGTTGL